MSEEKNLKLADHLMHEDFFNSNQYMNSVVKINSVEPLNDETNPNFTHIISVNLTMMDSTKSISFPAIIILNDNQIITTANFNIDRTQWGIYYKAAKSFGDKQIYPLVNIALKIIAIKQ